MRFGNKKLVHFTEKDFSEHVLRVQAAFETT